MHRLFLLAGLAAVAIPALPATAEAHGGWERHRWERHHARERHEWRREQAWRRHEWRRRHAYRHGHGYGYGPPVAYAQPGVTLTIPFR